MQKASSYGRLLHVENAMRITNELVYASKERLLRFIYNSPC